MSEGKTSPALTPAQRKLLGYFVERELPVGMVPLGTRRTLRCLVERGLVAVIEPAGRAGMLRWMATAEGKEALKHGQ